MTCQGLRLAEERTFLADFGDTVVQVSWRKKSRPKSKRNLLAMASNRSALKVVKCQDASAHGHLSGSHSWSYQDDCPDWCGDQWGAQLFPILSTVFASVQQDGVHSDARSVNVAWQARGGPGCVNWSLYFCDCLRCHNTQVCSHNR